MFPFSWNEIERERKAIPTCLPIVSILESGTRSIDPNLCPNFFPLARCVTM